MSAAYVASKVGFEVERLIREFATARELPLAQLRLADTHREQLVSVFLDEIRRGLVDDPTTPDCRTALFFIFHLLGSWKETRAYRPLAQLLRLPPERLHNVLGDAIPVTSHRVMMNVFDGDTVPLCDIIMDPAADSIVRSRMLETLAILTLRGTVPRSRTTTFLRSCFIDLQPQADCAVWFGWQSAISMLGLSEIKLLVKQAFERGSIDSSIVTYKHFNDDLKKALAGCSTADSEEYKPFGNTADELAGWSSYR